MFSAAEFDQAYHLWCVQRGDSFNFTFDCQPWPCLMPAPPGSGFSVISVWYPARQKEHRLSSSHRTTKASRTSRSILLLIHGFPPSLPLLRCPC